MRARLLGYGALLLVLSAFWFPPVACAQEEVSAENPAERIVHEFDFDERDEGNLEDVPKYWEPMRMDGFPRFASGAFDWKVGYSAPPSFRLHSEGRSVAYRYAGPETRVRANTSYRIVAHLRPSDLARARVCLSAFFVDRNGQTLIESLVRSPYVANKHGSDEWSPVELFLPAAPQEAFSVGLAVWVLQEDVWNISSKQRRHIPFVDVRGGAWIDDVVVFALPRVELKTSSISNVLSPGSDQELIALIADDEQANLHGKLTIHTAKGELVDEREIPITLEAPINPTHIPLEYLAPGIYIANLDVLARGKTLVSRTLQFARVAAPFSDETRSARSFGVVLDPTKQAKPELEIPLLYDLRARSAKVPVWTGQPDNPMTTAKKRAHDQHLHALVREGFALTGVLFGPPAPIVRQDGAYPRPLFEMLAGPTEVWEEHLASVAARNASIFRAWQVGPEGGAVVLNEKNVKVGLDKLQEVMQRFITMPLLVLPTTSAIEPQEGRWPVTALSLAIGDEVQSHWIKDQVKSFRDAGFEIQSAYLEPLDGRRFSRESGLASWAKRIIRARHAEIATVYVPQPWHVRRTKFGSVVEPDEEYIVFRTLADVIGDAKPGPMLRIAPDVKCVSFQLGDESILALWDRGAPQFGRVYAVQLGAASRRINLWGESTPIERDEAGRHLIRLTQTPVLIDGSQAWLTKFRSSFALSPSHLNSGSELTQNTLKLENRTSVSIAGEVRLQVPESWEVTPRRFDFSLMSQRAKLVDLTIKLPHNEPAGKKSIIAKVTLTDGTYLEIPMELEVGLKDIVVTGMASVERGYLRVRHSVTNHSKDPVHFRGAAVVRGRERQYRPITNLAPGETQVVEYRFANGRALIGSYIRVELREMNDGPRTHTLSLLVP